MAALGCIWTQKDVKHIICYVLRLSIGCLWMLLEEVLAEGEGFEPPVPFQVQRFSRPPVSTAHPSLRGGEAILFHQFTAVPALSSADSVAHWLHTANSRASVGAKPRGSTASFLMQACVVTLTSPWRRIAIITRSAMPSSWRFVARPRRNA
jgi:hypothetical protein